MEGNTQLAMGDCYLHEFEGPGVVLSYWCETEEAQDLLWAAQALDAVDELRTLVQPLSANLWLGCRDKSIQCQALDVDPPCPTWFIHKATIPENIVVRSMFAEPQISQASELTKETLMAWIERAFQQQCPCSDTHDVAWYELNFYATRSRIHNEKNFKNRSRFILDVYEGKFEFPLERRDDGLWVYSPTEYLETQPAICYKIYNLEGDGVLQLKINAHWSWWTRTSPEDNQAFKQAVIKLINKGWKLSHNSVFDLAPSLQPHQFDENYYSN